MHKKTPETEKKVLQIEEQILSAVAEEKGYAEGEIHERIGKKQFIFFGKIKGVLTREQQLARYMKEHHLDQPETPEVEALQHMTLFDAVAGNQKYFATLIARLHRICPDSPAFDPAHSQFNIEDLKTWTVDEVIYHFLHKTERFANGVPANKVHG